MSLYPRQFRLTIDTWSGQSIDIPDGLRVTFTATKNITQSYQFAEITIYNLSPDTETDIFKNGQSVTLEAGYVGGPYGIVFKGPIRQPIRGKENATDYFLRLVCIDGDDFLNLNFASVVFANNTEQRTIINQICRSSRIPFSVTIDEAIQVQNANARGKVVFGNPADHLRSFALANGATFYFDDGEAKIESLIHPPPPVVPELNAQTGMVGIPHQTDNGVEVRCLINPTIRLGSWVKLNNADIVQAQLDFGQLMTQVLLDLDGLYRVVEIAVTGDTRGNDWYYDLTTISQTGALPAMLAGGGQAGL